MKTITKIIIHCSDSNYGYHDDIAVIDSWHRERNFKEVGYNYYISKSLGIQFGRSINKPGAHTLHYNNDSIGICIGGKNNFTDYQKEKCRGLIINLMQIFALEVEDIYGHYELDFKKTCPNIDMDIFRAKLREEYYGRITSTD